MTSLMKLVRFLSERYDIPVSRIYGHNTTPGHSTNTSCPGRYFPMSYVKENLEKSQQIMQGGNYGYYISTQ
jgi:hypothetical protein